MVDMNKLADRIDQLAGKHPTHSAEEVLRILGREFPSLTVGQFRAAAQFAAERNRDRAARNMAESEALERVAELCQPVFDDGRAKTIGEAINILATEGNETARELKAQFAM